MPQPGAAVKMWLGTGATAPLWRKGHTEDEEQQEEFENINWAHEGSVNVSLPQMLSKRGKRSIL